MKMKWMIVPALCLGLISVDAYAQKPKAKKGGDTKKVELKTTTDSVSYVVGMNLGQNIKKDSLEMSPEMIAAGIADALAGTTRLTTEQAQIVMIGLQERLLAKAQQNGTASQAQAQSMEEPAQPTAEEMERMGADNKARGAAFMAENAKKPGVKSTGSGLQYQVMSEGSGASPTAADNVRVHYEGRLIDGTVFDSSVQRNEPITFNLGQVIPGWTEGVQLMKVGAKYRFFIPSDLAYGPKGFPGSPIGPNSTLVFDVELLAINP